MMLKAAGSAWQGSDPFGEPLPVLWCGSAGKAHFELALVLVLGVFFWGVGVSAGSVPMGSRVNAPSSLPTLPRQGWEVCQWLWMLQCLPPARNHPVRGHHPPTPSRDLAQGGDVAHGCCRC